MQTYTEEFYDYKIKKKEFIYIKITVRKEQILPVHFIWARETKDREVRKGEWEREGGAERQEGQRLRQEPQKQNEKRADQDEKGIMGIM